MSTRKQVNQTAIDSNIADNEPATHEPIAEYITRSCNECECCDLDMLSFIPE